MSTYIPYTTEDRQWDARVNVPTTDYLTTLTTNIRDEHAKGKFKYILIGGVEIGTRPTQNDYQCKHVHIAAIFHNRCSKSAIIKNWGIVEGHGYYLVPRNRELPYSGWRNHHIKDFSKVSSECVIFEAGEIPKDIKTRERVECSENEKKRKLDEILIDIRTLVEEGKDTEAWTKYPRNYLTYGEKIKALVTQKRDFFQKKRHPNIWLHGSPGSGKTAILNFIYPDYYKKNLTNKFFDLFDPKIHTHVILEDLDMEAIERLGLNFIKTICDEAGFPIDQKYKTPQLIQTTCLVTSNFTIPSIINNMDCNFGVEENRKALMRRFLHVSIYKFLELLSLKLIPRWDIAKLKKEGNQDPSKLFITWDYLSDSPICKPLEKPEYYQELIRNHFYS